MFSTSNIGTAAIRMAIGLLFLVTATGKLKNPREFARGIIEYQVLPAYLGVPSAWVVIALELSVGVGFITAWNPQFFGSVAVALLSIFLIAIAVNVYRGTSPPCYCFGQASSERLSSRSLIRVAVLLSGSLLVALFDHPRRNSALQLQPVDLPTAAMQLSLALMLLTVGLWCSAAPDLWKLRSRREIYVG